MVGRHDFVKQADPMRFSRVDHVGFSVANVERSVEWYTFLFQEPPMRRKRYDVEYVVVGPLERMGIEINGNDCVPTDVGAGIAAFDGMVGASLEVVFQQGETTIYRVIDQPAAAPTGADAT